MEAAPRVSVVVPLFRNRETVAALVSRLAAALPDAELEIVAVDDRGGDDSGDRLLAEAGRAGVEARLLRHSENRGQNAAVLTGLAAARGDVIVVMDADLQDPPEVVPGLVEALSANGTPLAFGLRVGRWAGVAQIAASRLFKGFLFAVLGSDLPVRVGLFAAMTRAVRDRIVATAEPGEYLVGHLAALHLPAVFVSFPRVPRPDGGSGYSWARRIGLARSALAWGWKRRARPFLPAHVLLGATAAFAVAFLLLNGQPFGLQDDGFRYLLSRTWARGAGLFGSFDLLYPPGAYVWFGSWMRLFGEQVWVLRLGQALLVGLTAGLVFRPLHRHGGPGVAWSAALLLGVIGTGWGKMAAMAAVAAAVLSLDRVREASSFRFLLLGAGTGLLLGWREDSAVLLGAVTVISLLFGRCGRRAWAWAAAGAAAGFGAWVVLFWLRGESAAFVTHEAHRLWLLADRLTPAGRTHAAWPAPGRVASPRDLAAAVLPVVQYVPLAVYLGLIAGYVTSRLRRRPWLYHFRSHLAVLVVAAGAAAGALGGRWRRGVAATFTGAALAAFVLIAWQHHSHPGARYPSSPGRTAGVRLAEGAPPWAGLEFESGETMIALPWCPGWYAVEAVPPGTRILSALPRHLRHRGTLGRLEADLSRPGNRYVIVKGPAGGLPPPLRRLVVGRYRPAESWSGYRLWERRAP